MSRIASPESLRPVYNLPNPTFTEVAMKRAALLIALTLLAAPAFAGGYADLYGTWIDFSEQDGDAAGAGVRVGWYVAEGLSLDIGVNLLDSVELTSDDFISGEIQLRPIDLGVRYAFPFGLYLGAGASYVFFDTSNLDVDEDVGFFGRVGYEQVGPSGWGWFVEGVYRDVEAELFGIDADLSGAGFAIGGKVKW